jgi:hypothetical protein
MKQIGTGPNEFSKTKPQKVQPKTAQKGEWSRTAPARLDLPGSSRQAEPVVEKEKEVRRSIL